MTNSTSFKFLFKRECPDSLDAKKTGSRQLGSSVLVLSLSKIERTAGKILRLPGVTKVD
jgi:hypothetical protein